MAHINEGVASSSSTDEALTSSINNLYAAFEQSEDQLRMALFNRRLARQSGGDYRVDFYYGSQVSMLSEEVIHALAICYRDVFNESWDENWTVKSALEEIQTSLQEQSGSTPVLSLLFNKERVVGFCMLYIIDKNSFSNGNTAFSSSKLKRHESIEVAQYWVNEFSKDNKFAIIRELGVLKENRQDKAIFLCLPVLEKAYNSGCKVVFFRTKITSSIFKLSLGAGFVPLQFFIVDDLLLMQGNLKYTVNLFSGALGDKKRENWKIFFSNIDRYLCQ